MADRIDAHFVAAGKYHDIDFARLEILKLLAENPRIRTTVAMDYGDIERITACKFLVTYTCDLMPSVEQTAAIQAFLAAGGRWRRGQQAIGWPISSRRRASISRCRRT